MLLAVYAATLAPGVTPWDSGELIAAAHGLGIPHPPGTPLYVLAGRIWVAAAAPVAGAALALNLLSALLTASACGVIGGLVTSWMRNVWMGIAAGVAAGTGATVWRNATESEVYAAALFLSAVTIWAADRAGRTGDRRWLLVTAYCFGLAVPLHLFSLVAAPAAIALAANGEHGDIRWRDGGLLVASLVMAAGIGTLQAPMIVVGAIGLLVSAVYPGAVAPPRARMRTALAAGALVLLATSVLVVMLVRARHDPALNQGNPATVAALADVVARSQYDVAGLLPRQAPFWLQLGNVVQYADWQVALGLAPGVAPAWTRTPITVLYAAFVLWGAVVHRRLHRRSWRALLTLVVAGSVGVALYLNLHAGPSFGWGLLPGDADREARERDYFFLFAFVAWSVWAAVGAVAASTRWFGARAWPGVLVAIMPLLLNWRAADRGALPIAWLARDAGELLLASAAPRAVLFTAGDNDSYPLWYLQQVEGRAPEVVVVVVPLLPAAWYRDELARRWKLGDAGRPWRGTHDAMRRISTGAADQGRQVTLSIALPANHRDAIGGEWTRRGLVYRSTASPSAEIRGAPPDAEINALASRAVAAYITSPGHPLEATDVGVRQLKRLLRCGASPSPAVWAPAPYAIDALQAPAVLLDSACNAR